MIKQIKRGMALTILQCDTIGLLAIGFGSDKVTIQNSTLNEQTVEEKCNQSIKS